MRGSAVRDSPEGYADRGDDGREHDGPQVRVVYRLLVHHLSVVGLHAVRCAAVSVGQAQVSVLIFV